MKPIKLKKPKQLALSKVKAPKMIRAAKGVGKAPKMASLTAGSSQPLGGGGGRKRKRGMGF
jgi:hypothetical protein